MSNLKINKEELLSLYLKQVDHICEECDWKTSFGPKEIISIIANILETNKDLIEYKEWTEKDQNPDQLKTLKITSLTGNK